MVGMVEILDYMAVLDCGIPITSEQIAMSMTQE